VSTFGYHAWHKKIALANVLLVTFVVVVSICKGSICIKEKEKTKRKILTTKATSCKTGDVTKPIERKNVKQLYSNEGDFKQM